jgi:hypothetical protein
MSDKKIFTYVSPRVNDEAAGDLCSQMPITLRPFGSIEELFPLLSDPNFHTDYVAVCYDALNRPNQGVDMFSVLMTLDTLIRSTVRRVSTNQRKISRRNIA